VAEAFEQRRIAVEGNGGVDERTEVEVRLDAALAHHGRASRQHGSLCRIAANRRDDREPFERLMQGDA
jgi:hypothetical protein